MHTWIVNGLIIPCMEKEMLILRDTGVFWLNFDFYSTKFALVKAIILFFLQRCANYDTFLDDNKRVHFFKLPLRTVILLVRSIISRLLIRQARLLNLTVLRDVNGVGD